MNEPWRITLLGGLRIERGEQVVSRFKSQKVGALLAYLAHHRQQMHAREVLIATFWPDSSLEAGRNSLSVALSSLRHQLEPPGTPTSSVIRADRFSVGLNPAMVTTDAAEFEAAVKAASRATSATERAQFLTQAVELYVGPLLPGFYEEWITGEQERLAGLFFDAAGQLITDLEAAGDLNSALRHARHTVSVDRLREEGHQHLIRLLAAMGQPGAALRQYRELERLLDEESGEEPSAALRALARQIERQSGLAAPPAASAPAPPRPASLSPATVGQPPLPDTVTFLMTDIEGSTRLWERAGHVFKAALETHHALLRREFARFGGQEIKEAGDSFLVAFGSATKALDCAIACQQALASQEWPEALRPLGVRMALHTGDVEYKEGDYHGLVLHRVSRMLTAAHGGQILLAEATATLVRRDLDDDVRLADLGVYRLRDVPTPERLFQVEHPGMAQTEFGPLTAEAGYQANLPPQFTRFFGRQEEITRLSEMLLSPETCLVTLTGPGGTGKTRLALEVAERLVDAFGGAVYFAPLADLSDPRLIADAVLDALRLPRSPQREPLEQIIEALNKQPSLLVLDNFEHLVEGGAQIVQTLLARVPSLTVLVTSRQLLGLSSEREFVLSPLPTPNGGETPERLSLFESVQLFVDRAQQVKPDFQVTNHNAAAVAELCNRLEGIPLALELAAARALVLTPAQMLNQLGQRFGFLVSRKRDLSERHRTLRAAVDWSYRLLAPELQRFFCRLSVFRGSLTVEAAETVCEEPLALDYLAQLRECSLVLAGETELGMRFSLLETLQEYGEETLTPQERSVLRERHLDHFLNVAAANSIDYHGGPNGQLYRVLEVEMDNLRAALGHCRETEDGTETELLLAGTLAKFWQMRGYWREGQEWLEHALSRDDARRGGTSEPPTEGRRCALGGAGLLLADLDQAKASAYLEEALALNCAIGRKTDVANAACLMALIRERQGDTDLARALYQEAVSLYNEAGERWNLGFALLGLAKLAVLRSEHAEARRLFEESLAASRAVSNSGAAAVALYLLGELQIAQGDFTAAREHVTQAVALSRVLGDKLSIIYSLMAMGEANAKLGDAEAARANHEELLQIQRDCSAVPSWMYRKIGEAATGAGDYARARAMYAEALRLIEPEGSLARAPYLLSRLSHLADVTGDPLRSTRLLSAAMALHRKVGNSVPPMDVDGAEAARRDALRQSMGGEAFAAAWEAGGAMSWEDAVAYALDGSAQ